MAEVVSRQAKAGIDIVNDGEFGKSGWANYSLERLSGFELAQGWTNRVKDLFKA